MPGKRPFTTASKPEYYESKMNRRIWLPNQVCIIQSQNMTESLYFCNIYPIMINEMYIHWKVIDLFPLSFGNFPPLSYGKKGGGRVILQFCNENSLSMYDINILFFVYYIYGALNISAYINCHVLLCRWFEPEH